MVSNSTDCDTFSVALQATNDTLCAGDSTWLSATGGQEYNWWSYNGGVSDVTDSSFYITPNQSSTYLCTITNSDGCSKVENIYIHVNPVPEITNLEVIHSDCGSDNGSVKVLEVNQSTTPFNYYLNSDTNNIGVFNDLEYGYYQLEITDSNNCRSVYNDSIFIDSTSNRLYVNFELFPDSGAAPLQVTTNNISNRITHYIWNVVNATTQDTVISSDSFEPMFTLDSSGMYNVILTGYRNYPTCSKSAVSSLVVTDSVEEDQPLVFTLPKVFSPNNDNENDYFVISCTNWNEVDAATVVI